MSDSLSVWWRRVNFVHEIYQNWHHNRKLFILNIIIPDFYNGREVVAKKNFLCGKFHRNWLWVILHYQKIDKMTVHLASVELEAWKLLTVIILFHFKSVDRFVILNWFIFNQISWYDSINCKLSFLRMLIISQNVN